VISTANHQVLILGDYVVASLLNDDKDDVGPISWGR